jgi:hypothetical protein
MERRELSLQIAPRTALLLTVNDWGLSVSVFIEPGRDQRRHTQAAHAALMRSQCTTATCRVHADELWLGSTAFAAPGLADQVAGFLTEAGIPFAVRPAQVAA